ncbi:rhodanese-like domain-containing protein [Arthrobacter cheniae]|uniref:rhodanese-like domain-containing protein n=1 Tax=Arthrobacter cheniae TaxID=1258888 RepID=UPI002E259021
MRSTAEWRTGRIPAAKHIPLNRLQASSAGIRKDRPVIAAVCQSGARSAVAVRQLADRGYDVYSLTGGMNGLRRSGELTPKPLTV